MAVYAGLDLINALGLRIGLLLQRCRVFHLEREAIVRCCGGCSYVGCLEGVGVGRLLESSAAFEILVRLLALQFAPLPSVLICELGHC